eukprot:5468188-Amphidinium_carterae.1
MAAAAEAAPRALSTGSWAGGGGRFHGCPGTQPSMLNAWCGQRRSLDQFGVCHQWCIVPRYT